MFGFSRTYRLAGKHDFQSVFANPNKTAHKYFLALSIPNQLQHARLGIVLSKHRLRLSVQRNRLRRLIRESFRHNKDVLKGVDVIILLRSECIPLESSKTIRKDIDTLWQKLKTS
ncbi:Ribonuclease P protein component [Aquicella siphonis]|uniref:Ribonuclease P protein component n=1 Tax=Aquicella siphonis TaxID=254247 RepID=A0A5E4PIP3_9COXI|nr:ribonuclease P protein component [Aquicella siphonis]VVC76929.1 Ribonuclease P protein component [Aquicella siphonis]